MTITWAGRLANIGATTAEVTAIQAAYNATVPNVQAAVDNLVGGIDNAGLLVMLTKWRTGLEPFAAGYPGGGLPFGSGAAILTGNPADDTSAISAGTGIKLSVAGGGATLDTTASDIQMNGTQAAGSTGKAADAGHVHPSDTSRAPIASPTFTGSVTTPVITASGLTGATSTGRYVGVTASGVPTSGTFAVGDWVTDQAGKRWTCTVAGTQGTWVQEPGTSSLATGASIAGATASSLVVTDGSGDLQSGPLTAQLELVSAPAARNTSGATALAIAANGGSFVDTLTANTTYNAPTGGGSGHIAIALALAQNATGGYTIGFFSGITWLSGAAPVMPVGASQTMVVYLESFNGGTSWIGSYQSNVTQSGILASAVYSPSGQVTYTSTTSDAAMDATNLVCTFTYPASGKVAVRLNGFYICHASNAYWWTVRSASATLVEGPVFNSATALSQAGFKEFILVGTPGNPATIYWGHYSGSGTNPGQTQACSTHETSGPAVMIVEAAV